MAASQALASDPRAELAANEQLGAGGTGVDALIAGFLAVAAADPGVLLCPMAVLTAGVGSGARCIDGRALQPGNDAARPRGFKDDEAIPTAAHIAVPRSIAALTLLHAYGASRSMTQLARPAAKLARGAGADKRAGLIEAIGGKGAAALCSGDTERALMRAAGAMAGGNLTEADLRSAPGDDRAVVEPRADGLELALPSFVAATAGQPTEPASRVAAIVVADQRGSVGALAYQPLDEGSDVPELEVRLPLLGVPVRRGVERTAPGSARPMAATAALLRRPSEGWYAALASAGSGALGADLAVVAALQPLVDGLAERSEIEQALIASVQQRRVATARAGG
jgi:gamma-glutamyltranspeptidase/glutathione hydrolase